MMGIQSIQEGDWLRHFPGLDIHADASLRELLAQARIVRLPPHQSVFQSGAACSNYLLVLDGVVRVHMVSENGREVTLYRVGKGDSCVLTTSCLLGQETYPAAAVTETEVSAVMLPAGLFEAAMDRSRLFRGFVFSGLGHRLAQVIQRMEEVALGAIDKRLVRFLLERMDGSGAVAGTHEAMAMELGTAREVVSRHLKRLEEQGCLRLARGRVEVTDRAALERLAGPV